MYTIYIYNYLIPFNKSTQIANITKTILHLCYYYVFDFQENKLYVFLFYILHINTNNKNYYIKNQN